MKDKEILAELKICYELLQDIIDNNYKQLKSTRELEKMQSVLTDKYEEIYLKIEEENDISLYYEENILISPFIYQDYVTKDDKYIASGDLDNKKWWEDREFLREF